MKIKIYLNRKFLNKGGYDASGTYWGHGEPLYSYSTDSAAAAEVGGTIRGKTREAVKAKIMAQYPHHEIGFFR